MSGSVQGHNALLPSLWDDKAAAGPRRARPAALPLQPPRRRPARHQFRRRQHLRQSRRQGPADRRRRRGAVGQGLRRRSRLDEARRLRHPLSRQAARVGARLSRARARGRDGRAVRPLHLQPQPARGLDRHAAARLRAGQARRPRPRRRRHRHRRFGERRGADPAGLRRQARLPAVAAAGLRSRPEARRDGARQSAIRRRRARRPRAVHLGADGQALLRDDHCDDQQGGRLAGGERQGARLRRRRRGGAGAREAPRDRGAADAGDPRPHFQGRAQGRPFQRRARGAGVRQFARSQAARRARHLVPRPFPAHQDPPAGAAA